MSFQDPSERGQLHISEPPQLVEPLKRGAVDTECAHRGGVHERLLAEQLGREHDRGTNSTQPRAGQVGVQGRHHVGQ